LRSPVFLTFPALAAIALLFFGGLGFAIAQSLGWFPPVGESRLTLEYYRAVLSGGEFLPSLRLTLWVSFVSTLLAAIIALALALVVRESSGRWRVSQALLRIPVAVPHLAIAVAAIHLIAPSGLAARFLHALGLLRSQAEFPVLVNDGFGIGIILVYVLKEAPFLALLCLAVLVRIEDDYHAVAKTLGASAWQRIRYVTLPLLAPVLGAGSIVVFAFVFSAFEVAFLMGRPYPAMLGVVAQRKFMSADLAERPEAVALAMLTAFLAICAVWACLAIQRRFRGAAV
jgi:putative spermidine/putrescine transport system permease protein